MSTRRLWGKRQMSRIVEQCSDKMCASKSTFSSRRLWRVSIRWMAHCLSVSQWIAVVIVTSAILSALNADNEQLIDAELNIGSGVGVPAVAVCTSKTADLGRRTRRPIRTSMDCQSWQGYNLSASTFVRRNVSRFRSHSSHSFN